MSKRRRITALIATVLTLSACTGTPPKATGPLEEVFTYANNLEIMTSWDPATSYSNEGIAMSNMYEQLTRYDSVKRAVTPGFARAAAVRDRSDGSARGSGARSAG